MSIIRKGYQFEGYKGAELQPDRCANIAPETVCGLDLYTRVPFRCYQIIEKHLLLNLSPAPVEDFLSEHGNASFLSSDPVNQNFKGILKKHMEFLGVNIDILIVKQPKEN